jgi:hypothetical protein
MAPVVVFELRLPPRMMTSTAADARMSRTAAHCDVRASTTPQAGHRHRSPSGTIVTPRHSSPSTGEGRYAPGLLRSSHRRHSGRQSRTAASGYRLGSESIACTAAHRSASARVTPSGMGARPSTMSAASGSVRGMR